jgi:hypothetical protein
LHIGRHKRSENLEKLKKIPKNYFEEGIAIIAPV